MRVFVTGATGVLGGSAVRALVRDGHEVTGLSRTDARAETLRADGARAARADVFDVDALAAVMAGYDAVCNLATHIPVGLSALRPGAWRANDRLRVEGSAAVLAAARAAGVRRFVQESVSFLYADGGDEWLTETSPLSVSRAVEPSAVAESHASGFEAPSRVAVVLRFGSLVGDDRLTRWRLAQARAGRPIGLGDPQGWAHVVHIDDAGAAVAAALTARSGVYNVGADPVRRDEMAHVLGEVAGNPDPGFLPRMVVKLAGDRLELLTRSHRVSAAKLHEATGWKPRHDQFNASWLNGVLVE